MLPEMLSLGGLSASQGLCVLIVVQTLWNSSYAAGSPSMPNILRAGGSFALFVARFTVALCAVDALIGCLVLPSQFMVEKKATNALVDQGWELVTIPVRAGTFGTWNLSGAVHEPESFDERDDSPTIIFLNPNGAGVEHLASFLKLYAADTNARIIGLNFRGVGRSQGWPRKGSDFKDDAVAAVNWAMKRYNLPSSKIILHGWSLGGGAALMARTHFPDIVVINDRSFTKLSAAAQAMMGGVEAGVAIGLLVGFALCFISSPKLTTVLERSKYTCALVAAIFAFGGLQAVVPLTLDLLQWEMIANSPRLLYSGPLCVVYHKQDQFMKYDLAALHPTVDFGRTEHLFELELSQKVNADNPAAAHMYNIRAVPNEWQALLETCVTPALEAARNVDQEN